MEKNVWQVCYDVISRINGEFVLCGDMVVYVIQRIGIMYFK